MRARAGGTGKPARAGRKNGATLRLEGELGLEQAAELRLALAERLAPGAVVVLDCSELRAVELPVLQLVLSAALTAAAEGGRLTIEGGGNPAWRSTTARAGLTFDQILAIAPATLTRNG